MLVRVSTVLLPYEITLFSNVDLNDTVMKFVLLPYEITLFSNRNLWYECDTKFYYLMKLHYSQTNELSVNKYNSFYYLMKLHYSQTVNCEARDYEVFYYLMKLHYSQTAQ